MATDDSRDADLRKLLLNRKGHGNSFIHLAIYDQHGHLLSHNIIVFSNFDFVKNYNNYYNKICFLITTKFGTDI